MHSSIWIDYRTATEYSLQAVSRLAAQWNSPRGNHTKLRATFRRWRPGADGEPTTDMCSLVWGALGPPVAVESPDGHAPDPLSEEQQGECVERAAVIVALRAAAGDHQGEGIPFGAALHAAEIGDLRFMRLITTPQDQRLEALLRAMRRIASEGVPIMWNRMLCGRLNAYLFGSVEAGRHSITAWSREYFSARGRTDHEDENADINADEASSNQ